MKPTLSALVATAVFKFGFRAGWKISILAGAATFVMLATPALVWERKDESVKL
jgi:hypothetical protein